MIQASNQKDRIQLRPTSPRQSYFVENIIQNEQIMIANTSRVNLGDESQKSLHKKNKIRKGLNPDLSSSCGLLTKRSYGSVGFNHQDQVQLNNRCSIQNNMITSDALMVSEQKRQKELQEEQIRRQKIEERFKKQAVNLKQYNDHLKMQEISDAYYFANQQIAKAKQRQTERQSLVKKVKALSRSKSKQVGLEFRKRQQEQLNSIKQVEHLKEIYSHVIVPDLMGSQSTFKNTLNTFNTQQNLTSSIKSSRSNHSKKFQTQTKSLVSTVKSSQKLNKSQKASIQSSKIGPQTTQNHLNLDLNSKKILSTTNQMKESDFTDRNSNSLFKVLRKSKSNEDFLQKERVKVIKQAFIINWKQGEEKNQEKYNKIYPCKYTENIKAEKEKMKQKQTEQKRKLKYGENIFKKNPLEDSQNEYTRPNFTMGYDTLKEYQIKFDQIAKNKIRSCIIAKN